MTCRLVLSAFLPRIIKMFWRVVELQSAVRNHCQIKQRETMPKARRQSCYSCTWHVFCISTKYHKNVRKGIWVKERKRNQGIIAVKHNDAKSKKRRVVILVRDTSSCLILHFYQVPSKYSEGYPVTERTRSFMPTPTGSVPKNNMSPPHFSGGGGGGGGKGT